MAKSDYLETLEKLQGALSSFDMSFSVSNKMFRFALVSEILDVTCLFEQLYTSWSEHLPFGEGPDADIDFNHWKDLDCWKSLLDSAQQNACIDDYPFDMGNGFSTDKVSENRRKPYLKTVNTVLRHSKYPEVEAVSNFVKAVNSDKTHMMTFGNMVFEALSPLLLVLGKIDQLLDNPDKSLFPDYYNQQEARFHGKCQEYSCRVANIMEDDIPDRRKYNKLNALKDEVWKSLYKSSFLDSLKDGINIYDIEDYKNDNPTTEKTEDEIRELLAFEELVDKNNTPNKEKIGQYVFEQRKRLSFDDISCFFVYLATIPVISSNIDSLNWDQNRINPNQTQTKTTANNTTDNSIAEAIQAQTEVLKKMVEQPKNNSKVNVPRSRNKKELERNKVKPRETMTFKRKPEVTEGHLKLLFLKLAQDGWISGNEADFKALFSGKRDEDCAVTWLGKYGKSTLVELFNRFVETSLIVIPDGYSLSSLLEGHFKDKNGQWLIGLDKGDAPNKKALPLIFEYVKLLKLKPDRLFN